MILPAVNFPIVVIEEDVPEDEEQSVMAGIRASVVSGEVALTATVAKTVLQLVAASNHRVVVKAISICFDGVSPTNEPVIVQICRQSTAGTSSAVTPNPIDASIDETIQTTARYNATVEPTTGVTLKQWEVHPQSGIVYNFPPGWEIMVGGGTRLGIICTAPNNVNAMATFDFEE
jgi:hypothetical protein